MMDYSHIHSLLKNYKTGVKIRFEYNLRNWRQKLGIPLKTCETNHHSSCYCINRGTLDNISTKSNAVCHNAAPAQKENTVENNAPLSPESVYSNNSLINMLNADDVFNFAAIPESGNNGKTQNTDNEIDMVNIPLQALGELLSDSDNVPPKFPSKCTPEKHSVSLKKILKKSELRGASIMKFYQEKNRLTNVHRSQLIQIIVDYFIENEYHLSLNLSHNLEWEIIKMFPTEKLEYYRTEKRGKIYAKFSNMKRYKRERNLKSVIESEMQHPGARRSQRQTAAADNETHDLVQENGDNWYPTAEPEIVVKEETEEENV